MNHKKQVVHINRKKPAYNTETWKPKRIAEVSGKPATKPNKRARQMITRTVVRRGRGSNRSVPITKGKVAIRPGRTQNSYKSSPGYPLICKDISRIPHSERRDPNYEPSIISRSRIELQPTRTEPPLTRARANDRTQDHSRSRHRNAFL
jgi:hypothetical protein